MLAVIECGGCKKEALVRETYECDKYTHYILTCGCEPILCRGCKQLGYNVMYAEGEYYLICDNCDCDIDDGPPEPISQPRRRRRRKEPKPQPAYTLDDIRKEHARAYLRWTDDEKFVLDAMQKQGKSNDELVTIFQRQPQVVGLFHLGQLPRDRFIPDSAAVFLLGERVVCNSCQHDTVLTYTHVEKAAKHLGVTVLDMSKEMLRGVIQTSFKCSQCKSKSVSLEVK